MGKASRKKRENKIVGMYSLTDPVVTKFLNEPIKRGSREYKEETTDLIVSGRINTATSKNKKIFEMMLNPKQSSIAIDMLTSGIFDVLRSDFSRAIQLGDYETVFIDDPKLFKLLSTSKVPDIDIREFIMENNIPHLVMPFEQYVKDYFGFNNVLTALPFISMYKDSGEMIMDEDHTEIDYLVKNCTVHILSLLFYVPRECSEYVIKVQLKFVYDETKKKFVFFHTTDGEEQPDSVASDIQMNAGMDSIYIETVLEIMDQGKVDLALSVLPCKGITERLRGTKDGKDIYLGDKLTKYSTISKMVNTLLINYILYKSSFPEFVVEGLPQHKLINQNAKRINISPDISDSLDEDGINLKDYKNKVCPHYRRGYFRVLQSEKFINKRFQTVWVKPTFIHKEQFTSINTALNK